VSAAGGIVASSHVRGSIANLVIDGDLLGSNLSAFVTRVDLSDLPDLWWESYNPESRKVVVRTGAGTEVPVDLVSINTGSKTGELFFKASLVASGDNLFTVEVVNGAQPAVGDTYGRNAVWSDYDFMCVFSEMVNRQGTGNRDPVLVGTAYTGEYTASAVNTSTDAEQGLAWDGTYWYTTNTNTLRKYNASYALQASNTDPCSSLTGTYPALNHCGDPEVVGGEIFIPMSDIGAGGTAYVVGVFNASDLSFNRYYDISGQTAESSICWNATTSRFVMTDYYSGGAVLHTYDSSFVYQGALTLPSPVSNVQSITHRGGNYYLMRGPLSGGSQLYRVADNMSAAAVVWIGPSHMQGLAFKSSVADDLWASNGVGDIILLDYIGVSADVGWLVVAGSGSAEVQNLPKRTTWTMGATAKLSAVPTVNNSILSYSDYSTSNSNRASLMARDAPDQWAMWNSTDTYTSAVGTTITAGDVGVRRRMHHVQNATTSRIMYRNGVTDATDSGCAQRPAGGSDGTMALFIGAEDTTYGERFRGALNYAYLRNGALTADWLEAEYASWEGSSFYTIT
jgi:hypothetical protein